MFEEILPVAIRNGLKRIAGVRADVEDPLVIEYLKNINSNVKRLGADQRFFISWEEAFEWIRQENEQAIIHV